MTGFQGTTGQLINGTVVGVEKNAANASVARGQFNIIMAEYIPLSLEGENYRISGNFFNVFPDGLTDYNVNGAAPNDIEAFIEIGFRGNNLVLGTDGDGVNDAEERNIFGGVTVAGDGELLERYTGSAPRTNIVIAGNYIGMAVDGTTRFTNQMKVFGGFNPTATVRVGSDFDGVSDDLEGNVIAMYNPAAVFQVPPMFATLSVGARVSLRGNRLIGNDSPPYSFVAKPGDFLTQFTNYFAVYSWDTNQVLPLLFDTSTQARLRGSCQPGKATYTNIVFDVYLADEEGWTNGQALHLNELAYTNGMGDTLYYGFAQGRTYLGSFVDNGPQDLDPTPGRFDFDISSFNVPVTELVTITANYSADPPGTHNGRVHTSDFAMPITLLPAARLSIAKIGGSVVVSWPTNSGLLNVQSAKSLVPADWMDLDPPPTITTVGTNYQASLPLSASNVFFRLKN